jgi:hypothetical protein
MSDTSEPSCTDQRCRLEVRRKGGYPGLAARRARRLVRRLGWEYPATDLAGTSPLASAARDDAVEDTHGGR